MRLLVPMLAAALVAVVVAATARRHAHAAARAGRPGPDVSDLYPYVVPKEYLPYGDAASRDFARPLGHDVFVTLVFDVGGMVRSVTGDDLRRLGLTADAAHARAVRNLEALAKAGKIDMASFEGPSGKPFVLVGGTWAATAIVLPRLRDVAAERIGTKDVCASIPHRDAMLLFAKGDRAYRDAMRALVREKESDGAKPLTFGLFDLTEAGPKP